MTDEGLVDDRDATRRRRVSIGKTAAKQHMSAHRREVAGTDAIKRRPVVVVGELRGRWRLARQEGQIVPAVVRQRAKCRVAEIEHAWCLLQLRVELALQLGKLLNVITG